MALLKKFGNTGLKKRNTDFTAGLLRASKAIGIENPSERRQAALSKLKK